MFDFTTMPERHGHDALAVDNIGVDNEDPLMRPPAAPKPGYAAIPMWIADMNFATAPAVTDAIAERLKHPLFGYFTPSQAYFDAIIDWHQRRNGVIGMRPEHIGYENGVLGGVVSALHAFATPGDKVLVHSPTYNGFTMSIEGAGFRLEHSPLHRDGDGVWRMDYEDMDRRLKRHRIHAAVFCSPHNPTGRVWERWEIERAMAVFRANDCVVVSDEIWSDLILDHTRRPHIPTQSVNDDARNRVIAMYAPSKTFNLAGLVGSYHVVYDPYLRDRLDAVEAKTPYNEMNVLSMHALIGAYSPDGESWLDELLGVLARNTRLGYEFIGNVPGVEAAMPEGTYMLFLDCERWCAEHRDELMAAARRRAAAAQDGTATQDGTAVENARAIAGNAIVGNTQAGNATAGNTQAGNTTADSIMADSMRREQPITECEADRPQSEPSTMDSVRAAQPESPAQCAMYPESHDLCLPQKLRPDADPCMDELLRQGWDVGVAWQDGRAFGGKYTIRMNVAMPTERVREALHRLETHVFVH